MWHPPEVQNDGQPLRRDLDPHGRLAQIGLRPATHEVSERARTAVTRRAHALDCARFRAQVAPVREQHRKVPAPAITAQSAAEAQYRDTHIPVAAMTMWKRKLTRLRMISTSCGERPRPESSPRSAACEARRAGTVSPSSFEASRRAGPLFSSSSMSSTSSTGAFCFCAHEPVAFERARAPPLRRCVRRRARD
jgi:hypothetical protein